MPRVGKKHYAYTERGRKAADKAKKKLAKKSISRKRKKR